MHACMASFSQLHPGPPILCMHDLQWLLVPTTTECAEAPATLWLQSPTRQSGTRRYDKLPAGWESESMPQPHATTLTCEPALVILPSQEVTTLGCSRDSSTLTSRRAVRGKPSRSRRVSSLTFFRA